MDVTIRKATADDTSFLAWVMLAASRSHCRFGLWEQFMGGSEKECLSFLEKIAATQLPHLFHYEVFLVAEKEGRPVAGLSGYDPATHGLGMYAKALAEIYDEIGWTRADAKAAFHRLLSYGACMPAEVPGGLDGRERGGRTGGEAPRHDDPASQ
jgi:hypothetical protein